jgi:hypothetical protein
VIRPDHLPPFLSLLQLYLLDVEEEVVDPLVVAVHDFPPYRLAWTERPARAFVVGVYYVVLGIDESHPDLPVRNDGGAGSGSVSIP